MKIRKLLSALLIAVTLLICVSAAIPTGAAVDRTGWIAISSASDFAAITSGTANSVKKYYLTKDITVNETINGGWNGAEIAYIELDGDGKAITLSKPLFNRFGEGVTIHDINLEGKIVWTKSPFMKSPLTAGNSDTGTSAVNIYNLNSDVDMEVSFNNRYKRFAGVIHYTGAGSSITNVKYTGSIVVNPTSAGDAKIEDVGGLVGTASGTTFTNCTNEADILIKEGVTPGEKDNVRIVGTAAGIAGETSNCSFINCTNNGDIKIDGCEYYTAGGIAGRVSGSTVMTNCKNNGNITVYACSNGLAGCNPYRIEQSGCSNTGKITLNLAKVNKVDGSCSEMAIKEHYSCISCGAYYDTNYNKVSISDVLGDYEHDLGELIPEKKATCLEAGMRAHYRCADCNSYFDERGEETLEFFLVTEAGHTLAKIPKGDATCFYPKVLVEHYFCIVCEHYFDKNMNHIDENDAIEGEALGHDYGELIAEEPASVGVAGTEAHYECSRCHTLFDTDKNEVERDELTIPALQPEPEGNQPEGNQPEGNQPEGNQPEGNQPEGNQPEGNQPEGNQPEGNQPEGNQPEGNQPEGNQPEGNQPEGNEAETNKPAESETEAPSGALPEDKEEKSGCSSSLAGGALVIVSLLGVALIKKEER